MSSVSRYFTVSRQSSSQPHQRAVPKPLVFLIQNTQNRDSAAVQLKLDELIRAVKGAHNALLDLEELPQAELDRLRARYEALAREARDALRRGRRDTDTPEVGTDDR